MANHDRFYHPNIVLAPTGDRERIDDWGGGLVVRSPNWLGDAVMAMPALAGLRQVLGGEVRLHILAKPALRELWQAAPWIDGIVDLTGDGPLHGVTETLRPLEAKAILVLPNSTRTALEAFFSGIPIRVGRGGFLRSRLLTRTLPRWRPGERQAASHQASIIFSLANRLAPVRVDLQRKTLAVADFADILAELTIDPEPPFLAVAPGAAYGPAKMWPEERFAEVAERWCQGGRGVVVVGTEMDAAMGARICAQAGPSAINLCGRTSLRQLLAVLQAAKLVVANDSGAMHLAAALGTSGVAIFGSTHPEATGPLGAPWIVLSQPPSCAPCFLRECRLKVNRYQCLTAITPEQVFQALKEIEP